jgi:hypothetical protein
VFLMLFFCCCFFCVVFDMTELKIMFLILCGRPKTFAHSDFPKESS